MIISKLVVKSKFEDYCNPRCKQFLSPVMAVLQSYFTAGTCGDQVGIEHLMETTNRHQKYRGVPTKIHTPFPMCLHPGHIPCPARCAMLHDQQRRHRLASSTLGKHIIIGISLYRGVPSRGRLKCNRSLSPAGGRKKPSKTREGF